MNAASQAPTTPPPGLRMQAPWPGQVSVIIPTHNRLHSLPRAVDSVLQQHPTAVRELIVVDDGSTDGTWPWLQQHRHPLLRCARQENLGVSAARNRGIALATGGWIAFLDSDDWWYADKVITQCQALQANARARLCHCEEHWLRNGRRVNPMRKHQKHGGWIFSHCLPRCVISPSAVMLRHDLLAEHGGFNERLPACEDYDLWLRICAREPVVYVDQALLMKTGGHADQLSRRYWGMDRFRITSLAQLLRTGTLQPDQARQARHTLAARIEVVSAGLRKREHLAEAEALWAAHVDLLPAGAIAWPH